VSTARTCPECGARVSAFAAGCSACGADLEAYHRRERLAAEQRASAAPARRRLPRIALPRPELTALEAAWLVLTAFAVAFISALGILLAVLGGMHAHFEGRRALLAVFAALGVVAAGLELARL
jgi:hypothetical protein